MFYYRKIADMRDLAQLNGHDSNLCSILWHLLGRAQCTTKRVPWPICKSPLAHNDTLSWRQPNMRIASIQNNRIWAKCHRRWFKIRKRRTETRLRATKLFSLFHDPKWALLIECCHRFPKYHTAAEQKHASQCKIFALQCYTMTTTTWPLLHLFL